MRQAEQRLERLGLSAASHIPAIIITLLTAAQDEQEVVLARIYLVGLKWPTVDL